MRFKGVKWLLTVNLDASGTTVADATLRVPTTIGLSQTVVLSGPNGTLDLGANVPGAPDLCQCDANQSGKSQYSDCGLHGVV